MKLEVSERYIRPDTISQHNITRLKILDEGKIEQTQFGDKFTVKILANDSSKTKFKLQLNSTNKNFLISHLGNETAEWIGRDVGVVLKVQENGKTGMVITA